MLLLRVWFTLGCILVAPTKGSDELADGLNGYFVRAKKT